MLKLLLITTFTGWQTGPHRWSLGDASAKSAKRGGAESQRRIPDCATNAQAHAHRWRLLGQRARDGNHKSRWFTVLEC